MTKLTPEGVVAAQIAAMSAEGGREDIESNPKSWVAWKDEADRLRARVAELEGALRDGVEQYGCICGHPACSRCEWTREAFAALAQGEEPAPRCERCVGAGVVERLRDGYLAASKCRVCGGTGRGA